MPQCTELMILPKIATSETDNEEKAPRPSLEDFESEERISKSFCSRICGMWSCSKVLVRQNLSHISPADFKRYGKKDILFTLLLILWCCVHFSMLWCVYYYVLNSDNSKKDTDTESKWVAGKKTLEYSLHQWLFRPFF